MGIKDNRIKAKCVICGREYWETVEGMDYVIKGKVESICAFCDGSHGIDPLDEEGLPHNEDDARGEDR